MSHYKLIIIRTNKHPSNIKVLLRRKKNFLGSSNPPLDCPVLCPPTLPPGGRRRHAVARRADIRRRLLRHRQGLRQLRRAEPRARQRRVLVPVLHRVTRRRLRIRRHHLGHGTVFILLSIPTNQTRDWSRVCPSRPLL